MSEQVKVGMIGTGGIGPAYVRGCRYHRVLDLVACADLDNDRAQAFAAQHDLQAMTVAALLQAPDIQIVINLTVPRAHAEVSLAIIEAGKHVHSEKPLGVTFEEGQRILAAAQEHGVRVGCAPDTFLGAGGQTARKVIDDGWIGEPVAATAFFTSRGPESWHENPFFFYQFGGGPIFDMGPYYLTALINLLGPVARLSSMARASFPERIATSSKWFGTRIPVEVPTHAVTALEFASGAIGNLITSFDVWSASLPRIEIYGTEGTLSVPDPNQFGGPVRVWTTQNRVFERSPGGGWHEGTWQHAGWQDIPLSYDPAVSRGIGVADLAQALLADRPHRASGALALHVLEIMETITSAAESGTCADLTSTVERPAALPLGLLPGELDG